MTRHSATFPCRWLSTIRYYEQIDTFTPLTFAASPIEMA